MYEQMTIWDCAKPTDSDDYLTECMKHAMFEGGEIRIFALYMHEKDAKARAKFLRTEYGIGGRSMDFSDGRRGFVDYNSKGVHVGVYTPDFEYGDDETLYPWSEAEKRIKKLIDEGRYLSEKKMVEWKSLSETPYPNPCYRYPPSKA